MNASVTCASRVFPCHARTLTTAHLCFVLCVLFHGFSSKSEAARSLFTHYFTNILVLFHETMSILYFSSYSLRSRTSFVVVSRREAHIFLWHGSKSSEDSRATAKAAAKKMQERYIDGYFSNLTAIDVNFFQTVNVPGKRRQVCRKDGCFLLRVNGEC